MPRRWLDGAVLSVLLAGCLPMTDVPQEPPGDYDRSSPVVTWGDKKIYRGQRVITRMWAGHIRPEASGFKMKLSLGKGHRGVVIEARKRDPSQIYVKPGESLRVVLVEWDPQVWSEPGLLFPAKHDLPSFRSSVHVQYLAPLN